MKKETMKKFIYLFIGASLLFISCNKDDDGINLNPTADDVVVQDFMWKAMNFWYFWQADVPDLADDRFSTNQEYTEYLQSNPNPGDFYNSLKFNEDRFSGTNKDFEVLLNSLSGIRKSNGLQAFIADLSSDNTDNLFLFVRNVIPESDAADKGIMRGDVFYAIDGQALTADNFNELLSADTFTLNKGELDVANRLVNETTEEITLTKEEDLLEPPIRLATTLDINGTKIGYLMYQRFNRDFKEELNNVFGQFVADGVTELVLDLRYNPGGDSATTALLASMIYGTNTNELFIRQRWNSKLQSRFSTEQLEDYFPSTTGISPVNTLNLTRVYVLATGRSASASELLINGLDPYIEVIHIGTTTRGKNEFSISLVDLPENNYRYSPSTQDQIPSDNKWIIQPLVGRNENSVGFIDYTAGFTPDFEIVEDVFNLGSFGNVEEPLLAKAIEEITGVSSKSLNKSRAVNTANDIITFDYEEKGLMTLNKKIEFK
ncbi:S41 family peptidase [uncultured Croceitalea sp.]|uniref:S41 family peptidase n=1 Tax=uncultured Croceitalea sp. TaxID=1798908 RepID=UPI00374EC33A